MAASGAPEAFGNLSKKVVNLSDKAVNLSEMAWNLSENRKARRSPRRDGNIGRRPPESKGFLKKFRPPVSCRKSSRGGFGGETPPEIEA